jgi:catechol 2,3-dioxygenase-like lactoylglutathione lyase family enzyme
MGSRLSHLFMLTSDLQAERRLLVEVVGLEVLAEEDGYLRIGGGEGFHIGLEQGQPGSTGGIEIDIEVDDLDSTYRRLLDAGARVEGPPQEQEWGARHVWFEDVDGRRMSAFSSPARSEAEEVPRSLD